MLGRSGIWLVCHRQNREPENLSGRHHIEFELAYSSFTKKGVIIEAPILSAEAIEVGRNASESRVYVSLCPCLGE